MLSYFFSAALFRTMSHDDIFSNSENLFQNISIDYEKALDWAKKTRRMEQATQTESRLGRKKMAWLTFLT